MIEVKEAVEKAVEFLREVSLEDPEDLKVEAVERTHGKWVITLGWRGERLVPGSGKTRHDSWNATRETTIAHPEFDRAYRPIRVADSGKVENMVMKGEARVW